MKNPKTFYTSQLERTSVDDVLFHVGHTEGGRSISAAQCDAMVDDLRALLDLSPSDRLLDLCCGNGAVTARLAPDVAATVGIDLVEELVEVARRNAAPSPVPLRYLQGDLRQLSQMPELDEQPFDRVLLHAALQHFRPRDFKPLLREILRRSRPDVVIVFGFVPEAGKQHLLLNTLRKRLYNWYLRAVGRDALGHWWSRRQLERDCAALGLECRFAPISDSLLASSHRFNMRMTKAA